MHVNINTDLRNQVELALPDGQHLRVPADKVAMAEAMAKAGVRDEMSRRGYAADVAGDLFWAARGQVTYDMPVGPVTFRFVPYTEPARLNLTGSRAWLVLAVAVAVSVLGVL